MTPDGVRLKGHFSSSLFSNKKTETSLGFFLGGEGEIRTRDRLASIPVFKTGALVHYATPPLESVVNPKDELTDSYALPKSFESEDGGGHLLVSSSNYITFTPMFLSNNVRNRIELTT